MNIASMQNSTTNTTANKDMVKKPVDTNENTVVEESSENSYEKKKRNRTSKVWDEFKEITLSDGIKKVECIYCKLRLAFNKSGPTT